MTELFGDFHAVTLRHSTAYRTGLSFNIYNDREEGTCRVSLVCVHAHIYANRKLSHGRGHFRMKLERAH